jgi:hypothetical protein
MRGIPWSALDADYSGFNLSDNPFKTQIGTITGVAASADDRMIATTSPASDRVIQGMKHAVGQDVTASGPT